MLRVEVQAKSAGAPPSARVRGLLSRAARAAKTPPSRGRGRLLHEVSVLFCADRRMRALNRRYRGKDRSTDVLAFPAGVGVSLSGACFLGDIVISVPYAVREARKRRETRTREIDRLLVHGLIHLMGYDHETDDGEMDALEARVRRRLGLADRPARPSSAAPARRVR